MNRRNRKNATYFCRHYYEVKASECCKENVREDGLIRIVKDAIIRQAVLEADLKELLKLRYDMVKQQEHRLEEEQVKSRTNLKSIRMRILIYTRDIKLGKSAIRSFKIRD